MKQKNLSLILIFLLVLTACSETGSDTWKQMANGVWKYSIGENQSVNLLDAAKATPNIAKLNDSEPADFPLDKTSIEVNRQNNQLYVKFPLEKGEQIYGPATNLGSMAAEILTAVGGSQSHNNMQPFLAINFIIALVGLYPSRS